jgi:DNA polymerase-1
MDDDLSSQFEIAQDVIKAFGIPVYDKAGYEADDILGTIATRCHPERVKRAEGSPRDPITSFQEIVIVTGDRDILQLVNDKVNLYMPLGGLANAKLYGVNETIERMGVPPEQIIDYKALVGDPSDNYKGVPGIGPKTAIKLLKDYGDLDTIYKNLDKLSEKTKSLLVKNKDSAYVSQRLATIVRDVDLDNNLEEMKKWQLDSKKVLDLFEEIGFKTLTRRVKEIGKKIEDEKQMTLV